MQHRLRQSWQRRGWLAWALWPLSLVFGLLSSLRRGFHRVGWLASERLPVPVIVVGNVIAGGAGKTPVTLEIVQHLQAQGWQTGIVSRGHGRRSRGVREVRPDDDPRTIGDEPLLLRRRAGVPVFVARRRAEAGRALLAAHPKVNLLVCDDGLQHLALARDVEVVAFDGRGIGNGWLLPAGPLREPWPRRTAPPGAGQAPLVLWTEAPPSGAEENPSAFIARRRLADHALRADGSAIALTELRGAPLAAIAGIARPEAFFAMLEAAGLTLQERVALPDHDPFERLPDAPMDKRTLLCTEKDAAKLWRLRPDALAVPLLLDIPPGFFAALGLRLPRPPDGGQR